MKTKTTQEALEDFHKERGRLAERCRRGIPGDPAIDQTRANVFEFQRCAGLSAVFDTVESRNSGAPPEEWIPKLRVRGVPLGVELLQAVEIIGYIVRLSDRPDEMVAALREQMIGGTQTT